MAGAVNRISTVLEVDASKAAAGFREAEKAAGGYESRLAGLSGSFEKNRAEWDRIGTTATVAGAAIAGGLGLAAKAAIDWDSAWAGVVKTTDGTPEQMAALESELRGLTKVLPATHEEIAGVAEAAGQLGIAQEDIAAFTKTAIDLGESTNLSAEEAATGLAKISNVMGTQAEYGIEGIERMGSTLVELGNNSATTEADILAMTTRLAGAGETAGASESDVLALAAAMSSVGIEAQLGGGAMSRAMLQMNSAVIEGGESLEGFARIAGMTGEDFAAAWRADPVAAVGEFVTGLGRMNEEGGDAAGALADVGLAGTENAQVFLRAAGASDLLTSSLELGGEAWEANAALSKEAAQRYETDAAQIQMAWNAVKDAAIDVGGDIAPVVVSLAGHVADLADAFTDLPGPVKSFLTATGALTGGGLLIGGAAIKAVGFANDLAGALGTVGGKGDTAADGLDRATRAGRGLARWGGYALGVAAVVTVLNEIEDAATPAPPSIEAVTSALLDLKQAGDEVAGLGGVDDIFLGLDDQSKIQRAFMDTGVAVDGFADAYRRITDPNAAESTQDFIDGLQSIIGMTGDAEKIEGVFDDLGASLAGMEPDVAAEKFDLMVASLGGGEETAKRLLQLMPEYADSLTAAENAARQAADGSEELAGGLSETEAAAQAAEDALDALKSALEMLGGGFRAEQAASRQLTESLAAMNEAANAGSWDELSASMEQSAEDALAFAAAQVDMSRGADEVAGDLARVREQVIQTGVDSGRSREFMEDYADSIGLVPEDAYTMVKAVGAEEAALDVLALDEQIMLLDDKTVTVEEAGALAAQGRVEGLDFQIKDLDGKTVTVTEIGSTAAGDRVVMLDGKIRVLSGKTVDVEEQGATASRDRVTLLDAAIGKVDGKQVNVGAVVYGTSHVDNLRWAIGALRDKSITVTTYQQTLYRNNAPGRSPGPWRADGGVDERAAGGGFHAYMANGGVGSFQGQLPHIRPAGGAGVTWAEEGAGPWEAWISGHPAKVDRSRTLADEVVSRLGGQVMWPTRMADGGAMDFARQSRQYATAAATPIIVQAPAQAPSGGADMSGVETAVASALSGWRPMVEIDGRAFHGLMVNNKRKRAGR